MHLKPWIALIWATILFCCPAVCAGESNNTSLEMTGADSTGEPAQFAVNDYGIETPLWTKTFGKYDGDDRGYCVQQTRDGGYIVVGGSSSFGKGTQVYLIKTDENGNQQWKKNFGGAGYECGYSVQQTSDGGYIVAGETQSYDDDTRVFLVKTDKDGTREWQRTFGGDGWAQAYSVQQTTDGGYIITGMKDTAKNSFQVYLIKTNRFGKLEWQKKFGGKNNDYGYSVQPTDDGGYIIAGMTSTSLKRYQVLLIKTNANGKMQWQKTFGGYGDDRGYSVQQTSGGGYIIAGTSAPDTYNEQVFLIKTNANGKMQWQKRFGGSGDDWGYFVQQTDDGGYIVAGDTESFGNSCQMFLVKTDRNGNKQWTNNYGLGQVECGRCVRQTSDKGYIIAGWSFSSNPYYAQVYLVKTGPDG